METVLRIENVSKVFPGVKALDDVSVDFYPGEVHAIMGENGAGKSTLMKIIAAIYTHDSGYVKLHGKAVVFQNPLDAIQNGIAMIHQELTPIPHMKVYENIFLGREPMMPGGFAVSRREMSRRTAELFSELDVPVDPESRAGDLSVAELQLVEIAKAVSYSPKILIMDEPTSALSESEVQHLYRLINDQKKNGTTILYISHKLNEVFRVADRVTVLRDGKGIGTVDIDEVDENGLIRMMVGRDVEVASRRTAGACGEAVLQVCGLRHEGCFEDVSFELCSGEVLGIAGLMGSGRTELSETLAGIRASHGGSVTVKGRKVDVRHPSDAVRAGITLVPEDRKNVGLNIGLTVGDNIMLPNLGDYSIAGVVGFRKLRQKAYDLVRLLRIKTPGMHTRAAVLSGGNQQKLVIAKWLIADREIIILDEPTRGIDIGAKTEIHNLIDELAVSGKAVIVISSELPEILALCDRVMVLCRGEVTGIYDINDFKEEYIFGNNIRNTCCEEI